MIYPNARLRPPSDRLALNKLGQPALWAYGVSGDLPMLVVTIVDARGLPLLRELLLAHNYWRLRGFRVDLIVFDQELASYEQPLRTQLLRQIEAHSTESGIDKPGGVFLRLLELHPRGSIAIRFSRLRAVVVGAGEVH